MRQRERLLAMGLVLACLAAGAIILADSWRPAPQIIVGAEGDCTTDLVGKVCKCTCADGNHYRDTCWDLCQFEEMMQFAIEREIYDAAEEAKRAGEDGWR